MNHHLIPIPAGTHQTHCTSCGQAIYFATHPATGRPHPVSTNSDDAREPTPTEPGAGLSHFSDCPTADQHRRARAATKEQRDATPIAASLDLDAAERTPLVGDSTKWNGWGGKPFGVIPDSVLRGARKWMHGKLQISPDERLARQVAAITVVLDHRAANSPQQSLAL